jgi:hypothetical protein
MDKELIDQLWNRATRETLNSGALNERYRFAELVAGHEREACAKVCDEFAASYWAKDDAHESIIYEQCAFAIRARGEA